MTRLSTFQRGLFTGSMMNLVLMITILTKTSHELRDLAIVRGSILWLWIFNLVCIGFLVLINLWIGGKKISISVQNDDLPPKNYPFIYMDRNGVLGYAISALVILPLYTGYVLWNYPEPTQGEKCAALQKLVETVQEVQKISPGEPVQAALSLRDAIGKLQQENYFLFDYTDDIYPAFNGIAPLSHEIYLLKGQEKIGASNAAKIKDLSMALESDLYSVVNINCSGP